MESHRSPSTSTRTGNVLVVTLFLILFLNPCLTAQPYLNQVGNQEATYLTSTKRNDLISYRKGGISISTDGGASWKNYSVLTDLISIKPTTSSDYMGVAKKYEALGYPIRYSFLLRTGSNQNFGSVLSRADSIIDISVHETGKLAASIYDGSSNRKILYSTNQGVKWDSVYTGLPGTISFLAAHATHIFYTQGSNVYRYQYGDSAPSLWMPLAGTMTTFHQMLDENTMVAFSSFKNRFLYTTNRGQNWIIKEAPSLGGVLHQTFVDGKVYRSNRDEVYVSADSGSTWTIIAKGLYPKHLQVLSGKLYAVSSILNKSFVTSPDSNYLPPTVNNPAKMIMKSGSKFLYSLIGPPTVVMVPYEWYSIDRDTVMPGNGKTYYISTRDDSIPTEGSFPELVFNHPFRYDRELNQYFVWEGGSERLVMNFSNQSTLYTFLRQASPAVICSVDVTEQSHFGKKIIAHGVKYQTYDGTGTDYRFVRYCDTLGIVYWDQYYIVVGVTRLSIERTLEMALINLGDTVIYRSAGHKPMFDIKPKERLSVLQYQQYFRLKHALSMFHHYNPLTFIDSIKVERFYANAKDTIPLPDEYIVPQRIDEHHHYQMTLDSALFMGGYSYNYRITAKDKSFLPEYSTVPSTGYFSVIYDPAASVDDGEVPQAFALEQNYPNPFNPSTTISYTIPQSGKVTLKVYSVLGSEVATLHDGYQSAGTHSVEFNAAALPSGVYFYRLEAGDQSSTRKLLLLK